MKKRIVFILTANLYFLFSSINSYAQTGGVTIGADKSPHPSAILDLQAINKGFLPPRMSSTQRSAINSPAAGLIVYDTDKNRLFYFNGTEWKAISEARTIGDAESLSGYDSSITAPLDTVVAPTTGSVVIDSASGKMAYFDGNVWRDVNTSCLPSLLNRLVYTRPGATASAFDTAGNLNLYNQNQMRRLYDYQTNGDLGIACEANDSTALYQSELLTDLNTYNGTKWNKINVNVNAAGTMAGRPRFLIIKTDNSGTANFQKQGLKLSYNSSYLAGILIQKASCTSARICFHSDGANTDGYITIDLLAGTITDGGTTNSGIFSNVKALPLKGSNGGYMLLFNFVPNTPANINTTYSFQIIPNSSTSGNAVFVAAPFIIQTNNTWATYIAGNAQTTTRGQENLKLDLGLQSTGTVLVKAFMNDRTTKKSRAISWKSLGATGLDLSGNGYTGGYAVAENGTLIEAAGEFVTTTAPSGGISYYIDPTAPAGGNGSLNAPFKSFSQLPSFNGDLGGAQIFIKRETRIREQLTLANSSNFTLDSYGSGLLPVIDASDTVKTSFIQEASVWYLPSINFGQTIFYNNNRLTAVKTKDLMTANINTSWFDAANKRMYINVGGNNPNTQLLEITSRTYACRITSCSKFVVRNIQFQRARNSGLSIESAAQVQASKNSIVEKCVAVYNGAFDLVSGLAGDGFVWYGMNNAAKASNNILRQCVSLYNVNCAYEFGFHDSLIVEDNYGTRNGQGIELWGYITNSLIRRNKIMNVIPVGVSWGHGNGLWMPNSTVQPTITGGTTNNKIQSNVFATTWQETLDIECGINEFTNNLFYDPIRRREDPNGSFALIAKSGGADSLKITLRNNIFYNPSYHAYRASAFYMDNTVNSATLDNNFYYGDPAVAASTPWIYLGTSYGTNFTNYKTATNQDKNSSSQVDPKFVKLVSKTATDVFQTYNTGTVRNTMVLTDEAQTDFHLSSLSPAKSAGDVNVAGTTGLDFAPFGTSRSVGPYSAINGNPISLGDYWMGGLNFRGGSLQDVQGSTGSLPNAAEVIKLSLCK